MSCTVTEQAARLLKLAAEWKRWHIRVIKHQMALKEYREQGAPVPIPLLDEADVLWVAEHEARERLDTFLTTEYMVDEEQKPAQA